jgi:type VI secretion system secreted protein VgrG
MAGENHSLRISVQGEDSFEVAGFEIQEGLSKLFALKIRCLSRKNDIDLSKLIGKRADFYLTTLNPTAPERKWCGVVARLDQTVGGQPLAGSLEASTYEVHILPLLWVTTQRRDCRVFQQKTIPDIVKQLLAEWQIPAIWEITKSADNYKKLDYVVQYNETDFEFISRLLERAGITYLFRFPAGADTQLVMKDEPTKGPRRAGPAIPVVPEPPLALPAEICIMATLGYKVAPGAYTMRDYEFRKQYNYSLVGKSPETVSGPESFFEQYAYEHGAFLVDQQSGGTPATPAADDRGMYPRHLDDEGKRIAERRLHSLRCRRRTVSFSSNCQDLAPGVIFSMKGHVHPELQKPLMMVSWSLEGSPSSEWNYHGEAVFLDYPWVPEMKTSKPRILGAQTAIVVGPKNEQIHTDEHGRVRVQFHWDREGKYDEKSSCWLRVSQDWAGVGFGKLHIPRIGQEVVVGFYDGDPDHPMVIGSVYNELNKVPYKLPENKTKSTWKSDTSIGDPNKPGWNELMFEDKKDEELVYQQAQRDLTKLVKKYETERVGKDRMAVVGNDRKSIAGELEAVMVGERYLAQLMREPQKRDLHIEDQKEPRISPKATSLEMIDKRVIFTTGQATVAFSERDIRIEADGNVTIKGGDDIIIEGRHVYINDRTPQRAPRPNRHRQLDHSEFSHKSDGKDGKYKAGRRELAKAPGQSPPQKASRRKVAKRFIAKNGPKKQDRRRALRDAIDMSRPVSPPNPYEPVLGQWQVPGTPRGILFAVPGTPPGEHGMFADGKDWNRAGEPVCAKAETLYRIAEKAQYLAFHPTPIDPRWLPKGMSGPEGGGAAYLIPSADDVAVRPPVDEVEAAGAALLASQNEWAAGVDPELLGGDHA